MLRANLYMVSISPVRSPSRGEVAITDQWWTVVHSVGGELVLLLRCTNQCCNGHVGAVNSHHRCHNKLACYRHVSTVNLDLPSKY